MYDEIFEQLYEEAVPGSDYFEHEDYPDGELPRFHYLDGDRQVEIIEEIGEEYGLSASRLRQVKRNVVLGKGPSANLEGVESRREEHGLKPIEEFLDEGSR